MLFKCIFYIINIINPYLNTQLQAVYGAMSVVDDSTHRLAYVCGAVGNHNMALFKFNPELVADFVKLVYDVIPSVTLRKISSRQDEIVLLEVRIQPMS